MAELLTAVHALGKDDGYMQTLARGLGLRSPEAAASAFQLAVPVAIEGLVLSLATESGSNEILTLSRGFRWTERNKPAILFSNNVDSITEGLTRSTFGDQLDDVVNKLAHAAGVEYQVALDVLEIAIGIVILAALGVSEGAMSTASFDPIRAEWNGPGPGPATSSVPLLHTPPAPQGSLFQDGALAARSASQAVDKYRLGAAVAAVLGLAVVAVLVFQGRGDSGESATEAVDLAAVDEAEDSIGSSVADPATDVDGDASAVRGETNPADADNPTVHTAGVDEPSQTDDQSTTSIVSYSIPMRDVVNDENEAAGTLSFDFNTETGEVCYSVLSANIAGPYRSHIHVGGADEKGGIVVDLGSLESGAIGCVDNHPVDIQAILDDRAGHYAELHDLSEEWTIRGQLSQAFEDFQAPVEFEVGSGGAYTVVHGGTVILDGEVSDPEAAGGLHALFAGADQGPAVVSRLDVVAEAPRPSGRIFLNEVTFGVNSSTMPEVSATTRETLKALLESKEDWTITAVGRTDGLGSELDNLELSLERAQELRDFLADIGIPRERIRVRGAGEIVANAHGSAASPENRLAEFEFVPGK